MQVANDPAQVDDAANDGADATKVETAAREVVDSALKTWNALNHDEPPQSLQYLYMRETNQRVVLSFGDILDNADYFEDGKWTTPPDSESFIAINNSSFVLNGTNAYQIDHMLMTILFVRVPPAVKDRAYSIILGTLDELHQRSETKVTDMQLLLDLIIERHADTHISIG